MNNLRIHPLFCPTPELFNLQRAVSVIILFIGWQYLLGLQAPSGLAWTRDAGERIVRWQSRLEMEHRRDQAEDSWHWELDSFMFPDIVMLWENEHCLGLICLLWACISGFSWKLYVDTSLPYCQFEEIGHKRQQCSVPPKYWHATLL